jgi:hypothetical protein
MTTAFWATLTLLILLLYRTGKPYLSYAKQSNAAIDFIKREFEQDADDSLLGPGGSFGVTRSIRFISTLDRGNVCVFLVESRFYRGNYPEHYRLYLLEVNRSNKEVIQCVKMDATGLSP